MATMIPGLYGLDSATAWKMLTKNTDKYVNNFAKDKSVQKEVEYFNSKVSSFKTLDDLMKDKRALQYVLDAYGMGSEINNAGRLKRIFSQDPTASGSLVNQLADTKFKTMATALRFDQGMTKLNSLASSGALKTNYIQNEFEQALGDQDPALRQAAYFARTAPSSITDVYSILGDKVMRDVVTKTFSLPPQLAIQPIESQARAITSRIDITKFLNGANASVSASQLSRAKSDYSLIETNLKVSDAALKQVKSLQSQLAQLATDYSNLDSITDPGGANAATITIQNDAVPELVRYQQMLNSGDNSMKSIESSLNSLQTLITNVSKPGASIASLKTQFSTIVASINARFTDTSVTTPDGSSENILLNGTNDTQTVVYDANGSSVSMNRYDSTGLQALIANAESAFNAITSTSDTTNIMNAQSRILQSLEQASDVRTQITADKTALAAVNGGTTLFAAALNTGDLMKGQQSVNDALSRTDQINVLLKKIGDLATASKGMTPSADRSALETDFNTYRTQLRSLIEDVGTAGLDNFLNGATAVSYEIVGGKSITVPGGIDLVGIADALDAASLSDATSATALETQAITLSTQVDSAKIVMNKSKPIFDTTIGTYDPRGKLDNQLFALQTKIDTIISSAAVSGKNLLSADQANITLDSLSTGTTLRFRAQNNFKTDFLDGLTSVLGTLGGSTSDIARAVDDLAYLVGNTQRVIQGDNRIATVEYGKLGATIDVLDPKNTSSTSATYKTNEFTNKFLMRYLTQEGSSGSTGSGAGSYMLSLFGGSSNNSAIASIQSLALSLKA